jgi:transglutaminase-like putative cysteine protease
MRIQVSHQTAYRYGGPIKSAMQILRLTPRNFDGQYVKRWRIDTEPAAHLMRGEDWFGNVVHTVYFDGPITDVTIIASGEVDTEDSAGIIRGSVERFPAELFLRQTALTEPDAGLMALADEIVAAEADPLKRAHHAMKAINQGLRFDPGTTTTATTAAEAYATGHGVCQDLTHVFLTVVRRLGLPARYVSGHLVQIGAPSRQEASHAWAEAHIPDLGWVSFDCANGVCATAGYVRVAIGLDYLEAAPVRGTHFGGSDERLSVRVDVNEVRQQQD